MWKDWSYDFNVALGAQSPEMKKTLEVVEGYPDEQNIKNAKDLDPERAERIDLGQRAAEIFQILDMKTEGEAKLMVKIAEDQDAIRAWQKVHRH